MSTTTIRLPEELKTRVAKAAERVGKTPHAFILDAIAEKTGLEEQREQFYSEAEARFAQLTASGESISWAEMRSCLEDRIAGGKAPLPNPRKLGR